MTTKGGVYDLRTLFEGKIDITNRSLRSIAVISDVITTQIIELTSEVKNEGNQVTTRENLADLVRHEVQLADLLVRMKMGRQDSSAIKSAEETLSNLRRAKISIEKILGSFMNEANNAT